MTLQPGAFVGHYEITGSLGAGGMGEVYRARDARLGRDVAIKILPERFGLDAERRARFEREARSLAALNHPHIGAIYGIEESGDTRALVLELIPGPTLADWLRDGPLPLRDALRIATQIASALAAAHERGIVHRDLKPANVILAGAGRSPAARGSGGSPRRDSGPRTGPTVKVVDFGLAKEIVAAPGSDGATAAATLELDATQQGVLVGTLAYMSPEQVRGERVDQRTDLWAFGCVLFEMLTGRAPHHAATLPDTLAAIVTREPDWNALPVETPNDVRRLLRRCLEKDPAERLRDAHDLRLALEDRDQDVASGAALTRDAAEPRVPNRSVMVAAALTMIGGVILGMLGAIYFLGPRGDDAPVAAEMRLEISTPAATDAVSIAISPDGTRLAYVADVQGRSGLWIRPLSATAAEFLAGTEGAEFPFWSPDSRALGFFADGQIKRIDLDVGAVRVLAPASGPRGASWGPDGTIVYQGTIPSLALSRVSAEGGTVTPLENLQGGRFPHVLPDGKHFLYFITHEGAAWVAAHDGTGSRRLLESDAAPQYGSGHLFMVRGTTLLAQRFDPATLTLSGTPFPVAADVGRMPYGRASFSVAADGPIVYRTGAVGRSRQFVWVDRAGTVLAELGEPIDDALSPSLSPDGSMVAFERFGRVWLLDARGVRTPLTTAGGGETGPQWTPDGQRVMLFQSGAINEVPISGGEPRRLYEDSEPTFPSDVSLDGRKLLCHASTSGDLLVIALDGSHEQVRIKAGDRYQKNGQFSPDSEWIAYSSNESGEPQVFMRRVDGDGRQQISTAGGTMPRFRRDGRELYYLGLDGKLMAVAIEPTADGRAIRAQTPVALFDAGVGSPLAANTGTQYMAAHDGKRFLMNRVLEETPAPITVILNWRPAG